MPTIDELMETNRRLPPLRKRSHPRPRAHGVRERSLLLRLLQENLHDRQAES